MQAILALRYMTLTDTLLVHKNTLDTWKNCNANCLVVILVARFII